MTEASAEAARRRRIEDLQVEILFKHAPLVLAANLLVATGMVWFLLPMAAGITLAVWWILVAATVVFRLAVVIGYRHRTVRSTSWQRLMTAATLVSGMVWGAAGVLFFDPGGGVSLIFITIILAGMTAGSVTSHFSWPPAQFAFALPTMMPIALRYLFEGGGLWMLGPMCLFYLLVMVGFARYIFQTVTNSIRLQIEKQELVQRLHDEKSASESARAQAEEANAAKSKFLAAASHDLRQPLQAANLLVEVLRREPDPAKVADVVEHLGGATHALEELLNELLDMSKLEAGMFRPEVGVVDLQDVFDAMAREMRPIADEKGIALAFARTRMKVLTDAPMLGRILRNMVANAIRYTQRGGVLVGCRRKGDHLAIAVYDTGPGIAPEHHEAIFREFYQLGNPERDRRKGLGLGLAIVDGLCRVLGHKLELASRVGRGTAFFVHAPIAVRDEAVPAPVRETASADLRDCAVLVIDDEPSVCHATIAVLARWGCRALAAESAAEALALMSAAAFEPDAIVADYRLREGRTGAEAIEEIRHSVGRPVPALILTGDTAPERLVEARASGYLLLHKPIQPGRLRAALAALNAAGAPAPEIEPAVP